MSIPTNTISCDIRSFKEGAMPCSAKSHSPTPVFDDRIQAMVPDVLAASGLLSNGSFSPLTARSLLSPSGLSSLSNNSSFALFSPSAFSTNSQGVTPAVDEDLALVQDKLGGLLNESGVSLLTTFLKEAVNQKTLELLRANRPFELSAQNARQLGFRGALEFVPGKNKYQIIEQLHELEEGYFVAAGAKKIVSAARKFSLQRGVYTVSLVARQAMTLMEDQKQIQMLLDIVKRHNVATQLANSGLSLVASNAYRIGCKLLIAQSLAPALTRELILGITASQAIKILLDISRGVAGLHAKDYAHRDLKPDNIGNEGRGAGREDKYNLNDFDTLCLTTARREPELPIGTPVYMSPEACRGGLTYDLKSSDVWSFGMTALEILSSIDLARSQESLPLHPFLSVNEVAGLMFQLGTLKREDGIDAYFSQCIAEKPRLKDIYELVRETLRLDPEMRITMAQFHEGLTALVEQKSEAEGVEKVG